MSDVTENYAEQNGPVDVKTLDISHFQNQILQIPESINLFLGGGRGGGKTEVLPFIVFRHCAQYGQNAKVLISRLQWNDLAQLKGLFIKVFAALLNEPNIRKYYNKADSRWDLPNGASVQFTQCEDQTDYLRHHGKSYSLLIFEELPSWKDRTVFDLIRTTLRQPGATRRIICTGNPGQVGHGWVYQTFARNHREGEQFTPFVEKSTGDIWVYVHSTLDDNPFLPSDYDKQFSAMADRDPELAKAWRTGSWDIKAGDFFRASLSASRNRLPKWPTDWNDRIHWSLVPCYDHGTAAPCAMGILAVADDDARGGDGTWFKKGSIVLVDELHSATPEDPNKGEGWLVEEIAERMLELLNYWRVRPRIVSDDACFSVHGSVSIASEFSDYGVTLLRAHKGDRVGGWTILRELMSKADLSRYRDQPGFYYCENCQYFEDCAFAAKHDKSKREDLDTTGADHILDAIRYGAIFVKRPESYAIIQHAPWVQAPPRPKRQINDPKYRERLAKRGVKAINLASGRAYGSGVPQQRT